MEIKNKRRTCIELDIRHSKVFSSDYRKWTGETSDEDWMDGDWRAREDCIGLLLERQVRTGLDGDGMVTKGGDLMEDEWLLKEGI